MNYGQELDAMQGLRWPVKRALQKACFNVRQGSANEQALYHAVFSEQTFFNLNEVVLLAWSFSWGDNDLKVLGTSATDAQVQICVDAILPNLISIQHERSKVLGLAI